LKISINSKISQILGLLCACYSCFLGNYPAIAKPLPHHQYHLLKKISLGGAGSWDYLTLDSSARRLYITRSTRVTVLNVDTGKVIGEISDTAGVHGVVIAPKLGRGFTSNGRASTVTIFDLKTLHVLGTVQTGDNPDAIAYDPFSEKVFVFNGKSNSATVFSAQKGEILGTIPLGGKPEFAVADELGQIYVNIEDRNELLAIDTHNLKIKARYPLQPCSEPTGISLDKIHHRLFIGCHNKLMTVVDAKSGKIKATLPIGNGVDATAFDPQTKLAFTSNGDGSLTIVHENSPNKFTLVGDVPTQLGARTMALDLKTHKIYLATAKFAPTTVPANVEETPRPKPIPGTFEILVFGY